MRTTGLGAAILLKHRQQVDEVKADDWIASYAHTGGLSKSVLGQPIHRLIGQGAASGDEADAPFLVDVTGHDADLAFSRGDDARGVGADEVDSLSLQVVFDWIMSRVESFGHTDDRLQPGIRRSITASPEKAGARR